MMSKFPFKLSKSIVPGLARAAVFLFMFSACSENERLASTQILNPPTTGVVQGFVSEGSGQASPGAIVRAFPVDFDPLATPERDSVRKYIDTTGPDGSFSIAGLDSGSFNLLAVQPRDGSRLFIRNVTAPGVTRIPKESSILQAPGAMAVVLPDTLPKGGDYLYVPGTPIYIKLDGLVGKNPTALMASIPAGNMPAVIYASTKRAFLPVVLASEVRIRSGDTVPVGSHSAWSSNKRIFLDNSGTGSARILDTVTDFPLLVRLDSGNFDFSQAHPQGWDIRFAGKDGRFLAHEIESWEPAKKRAAIWVRLDSVPGGGGGRFIRMYWGNASAANASSGPAVFARRAGFCGVWHLNERANSSPQGYQDASENGNHATGTAMQPGSEVEAIAGNGQTFDGTSTYLDAGTDSSLRATTSLTLEAWVRAGTLIDHANIISKAFTSETAPHYEFGLTLGLSGNFRLVVTTGGQESPVYTPDNQVATEQWFHLVGTYDGSKCTVFVNGVPVAGNPLTGSIDAFGGSLRIGNYQRNPTFTFHGVLDEVRVSNQARSADYVLLSYANQKPGSTLLEFDPD